MQAKNQLLFDKALAIIKKLRKSGFQAYFAGGVARDYIRGISPTDYDIATSAKPDEVLSLFPQAIPVGAAFGVVLVPAGKASRGSYGEKIEIATFRSDGVYLDGRHPQNVIFSNEKEDAFRRDFTINGMFLDPVENRIIDYVGGREDLKLGMIRTIGDPELRFKEDYLRLVRAVRFAAQFSFQIEQKTYEAIKKMVDLIHKVSAERIRDELEKILTGPDPVRGLTLLAETGILNVLLPEVSGTDEIRSHTIQCFEYVAHPSFELAMAILLHQTEVSPFPAAHQICLRLKLSNHEIDKIVSVVRNYQVFHEIPEMGEARLKRFLRFPHFNDLLELYRAHCLASHRTLELWDFCVAKLNSYRPEDLFPEPMISGNTLIEMGYPPGPIFKRILHDLEDRQLEGKTLTSEEARAWVLNTFPLTDLKAGEPKG